MWRFGLVIGLALMATGCAAPVTDVDVALQPQRSFWYAPSPQLQRHGTDRSGGFDRGSRSDGDKSGRTGEKQKPVLMANATGAGEKNLTVTEGNGFQQT